MAKTVVKRRTGKEVDTPLTADEKEAADLEARKERDTADAAYAEKVAASQATVNEAQTALDEAQAALAAAKAEHADYIKSLEPVAVLGEHILVDAGGTGTYAVGARPKDWGDSHERTVLINGQNFEHVDTNADGVWCYRRM
jgi:hypothetical protein